MNEDYIKKALQETLKQIAELFLQEQTLKKQITEIERQVFKLMIQANSLAALCDDIPANSRLAHIVRTMQKTGLTQNVRNVLKGTGEWMTPMRIRDYLVRIQTDLTRYANPLGSIHTILGRLVENEEVEQDIDKKTNKPTYRWKPPFFWSEGDVSMEEVAEEMIRPKTKKRGKKKE
jgi:hypothetical protein